MKTEQAVLTILCAAGHRCFGTERCQLNNGGARTTMSTVGSDGRCSSGSIRMMTLPLRRFDIASQM